MKFSLLGLICLYFFGSISQVSSQSKEPEYRPYKINFVGLKNTKVSFVENVLAINKKQEFSIEGVESDLQLLRNLPGIAYADYSIDSIDNRIVLNYNVEERQTALPIINFGGIRGNVWFSLGGIENNFRGEGETLLAFYQNNNGRHAGQVYFKKPRIIGSDWGYSVSVNKWASDEPVFFGDQTVEYLYNNDGVGGTLIRNFGLNYQIEFGGTYFVESYEKNIVPGIDELPGPDNFSINKALIRLELKQNHLNYNYIYLKGLETLLLYQNVISFGQDNAFNSLQVQLRSFYRPSRLQNIAIRFKLGVSTNNDSPFAPFVADSHFNIRGIGNRIDRGTAQVVLNIESRHTLYHHNQFSSQFVIFSDSGSWRNPGGELVDILSRDQYRQFMGIGFRFNYQKVFGATLRIDYGIDVFDSSQRGFVIGLGQYY